MSWRDPILTGSRKSLRERYEAGFPVDPGALAGWRYRGISLGLPRILELVTWKTFCKAFVQDGDRVRGWNLRLHQDGLDAPIRPLQRKGRAWAFGHFAVRGPDPGDPGWTRRGLVLDYRLGGNPAWDLAGLLEDPIVALEEGSAERLLGWSYLRLAGVAVPTISWFLLERLDRVDEVVPPPRPPRALPAP